MLSVRLAWRNVWRNSRRTAVVLTAVSVGIAGVLLSMAINNGLVLQMVDTAIRTEVGHIQVHAPGFDRNPSLKARLPDNGAEIASVLNSLPSVRAWAPRVRSEGLLFSPRAAVGVRVVGIDPARERNVSIVAESLTGGHYLGEARRKLLVGEALARRLRVKLGSRVVLSVQALDGDLTGEAYRVGGLFRTASLEFDRGTVFIGLDESRKLFGIDGAISEVVVVAKQPAAIPRIEESLRQALGKRVEIRSWKELRPLLVQTIEIFDATAWYVYAAIFIAMVFGIANVLLMSVYERIREIGILTAIGMRPRRLVTMIVAESMFLTIAGLLAGYGIAMVVVALLHNGIDLSRWAAGLTAVGVGTRIVPVIRPHDVGIPILIALLTSVLASLWPALRAVRIRPADAVRHI